MLISMQDTTSERSAVDVKALLVGAADGAITRQADEFKRANTD